MSSVTLSKYSTVYNDLIDEVGDGKSNNPIYVILNVAG